MGRCLLNPFRCPKIAVAEATSAAFRGCDITELHGSLPGYEPTPLVELPAIARELGVGRILVKDESHRFGLKRSKALGASYAIYRFVSEYLAQAGRPCLPAATFYAESSPFRPAELTFCTATDGNHGRGVAWAARLLEQKGGDLHASRNGFRLGSTNIRGEGAEVVIVDGTYDDAVSLCARRAVDEGWAIISDTSWPGY